MPTKMLDECLSAPAAVARQLAADQGAYAALGEALREAPPSALLTVARGSSDHAAHYMAYLMMARLGRLVTSLPMSLITLYQSKIQAAGLVSFAFSQSGQSPDLVAPTRFFRAGGARTVAFVNAEGSPLAEAAQYVFPLHAGPEQSVAATKSYIAQLVAGARVVAAWSEDRDLQAALQTLPQALEQAARTGLEDWSVAVDALKNADRLFVIGRGTSLAIAQEAALKFKETCAIQAEAFSGAEVKHGPMALVDEGYPLLVFAPRGPAQAGLLALAEEMRGRGARVLLAAPAGTPGAELPLGCTGNEELDPIAAVQSFYPMVEALARARGLNPDQPRHLAKVTRTH
jgi:glucosamine--fructose-6-phosphate aminotransferase (isomerizing)